MREDTLLRKPICVATGCLPGFILLLVLLAVGSQLLAVDRLEAAALSYLLGYQSEDVEWVGEYIRRKLSARGVQVVGDYAYVADEDNGLRVIDISNPAAPTEIGFYDTSGDGKVLGVFVAGDHAYLAAGSAGLRVVNVSDPAAPREVGAYDTPGSARKVYVAGDYAYLTDWWSGLRVVNVSDPAAPREVGAYDPPGSALGVYVAGDYAYITDWWYDSLRVVDVSDPAAPTEIGAYEMPGVPFLDVYVIANHAYVAAGGSGLRVIDVSDPAAPHEVGSYVTPPYGVGYANSVQVVGNPSTGSGRRYAYVTYDHFGHPAGFPTTMTPERVILQVIDVSDPAAPVEVATYATSGSAFDVHVAGEYVYLAYDWARRVGGLIILRFTGAVAATSTPSPTRTVSSTTAPTATVTLTPISTPTATVTPTATATPEPAQHAVYLPYVTRSSGSD